MGNTVVRQDFSLEFLAKAKAKASHIARPMPIKAKATKFGLKAKAKD